MCLVVFFQNLQRTLEIRSPCGVVFHLLMDMPSHCLCASSLPLGPPGTNLVTTIVFKDAPMHHRHRIEVRRRYVFTSLKKTTMFKDDPIMRCDLFKPSSNTTIVPLRPDYHMPPPPAPPPASSSSLLVPPSSRVATSVHVSKRARVEEVPSTDDFAAPPQLPSVPQPPATETCRTVPVYTGTVTAVVHATGMLYELDGTVLLLCSHWQTASRARELRPGNRVRIYNAHALRGPVPDWPSALSGREKHVGVLGCCVRTTIDVVSYGPPEKRAVMANSSNPLLRTFSKQLTLARFVGFLPMYDAMAEKFGGTNATGEPASAPRMSRVRSSIVLCTRFVFILHLYCILFLRHALLIRLLTVFVNCLSKRIPISLYCFCRRTRG